MSNDNFILYKKSEAVLFRIYPALKNFPKSEKHALCTEIKTHLIALLRNISLANAVRSKRAFYLQEADGWLQNVKVLFRLSRVQHYISIKFHEELSLACTEIGSIINAIIKNTSRKSNKTMEELKSESDVEIFSV